MEFSVATASQYGDHDPQRTGRTQGSRRIIRCASGRQHVVYQEDRLIAEVCPRRAEKACRTLSRRAAALFVCC